MQKLFTSEIFKNLIGELWNKNLPSTLNQITK